MKNKRVQSASIKQNEYHENVYIYIFDAFSG